MEKPTKLQVLNNLAAFHNMAQRYHEAEHKFTLKQIESCEKEEQEKEKEKAVKIKPIQSQEAE